MSNNLPDQSLDDCASEPIHIPGSIQPHGFMLVLAEGSLTVLQASANCAQLLGAPPEQLLGQPLASLLRDQTDLTGRIDALLEQDSNPSHFGEVGFVCNAQARFEMMVHRHDGVLIAEFEPQASAHDSFTTLYPLVRHFVGQLQEAGSVPALCELAAQQARKLTGFGRVMVYRFDADYHGQVLAEALDPGYDSYLDLHFPASDIPAQARELYRLNRLRVISDANYQPSALVPPLNPTTQQPLDMSLALLRSVSPVHLQYMRNMGTLASMSISLVVDGRLWGLISCHNTAPLPVSFQTRSACELLGRILSLQLEAREAHAQADRRLQLRHMIVQMLALMADRDGVAEGLQAVPDVFMSFGAAAGAAVVAGDRCITFGQTPPNNVIHNLVGWLGEGSEREVYASDSVRRDIPAVPELAEYCAGIMAVSISELHSHYLVWFRPETVQTVTWAGKPGKAEVNGKLNPRASFAAWEQTVRDMALPWDRAETEGAVELRNATLGIVLRKAEEMAALAEELRKSNKELEAFSYSVSHDLRAPLRHIVGYAELLGDFEGTRLSDRGTRFLDHIGDSARFAGTLVDNLLTFSQMGRSALRPTEVDVYALIESVRLEMTPDLQDRNIEWKVHPMPRVIADAAFLHLALRNLLSNAVKYTRGRDPAVIEIGAEIRGPDHVIYIKDNGVGFHMDYANKLFGVFQRLHRMEEFEGTGIGLANVRRIIERHDGRTWAEGELDKGATFWFSLPRSGPQTVKRRDAHAKTDLIG
ncbi:ATP-binding protein [Amantichitinum ursilacus]|uniref:histidine kinase n=1 Tax=Amantichitinum ursilacus TaxID=857265 RepID=A0A0N1JRF9_9NEIS|nr:ATP-binding protein [Amantichitinum ursilacus]KPC49087.1 Phytochrome-like protein cph1 [Amantichitinum ursilacus]